MKLGTSDSRDRQEKAYWARSTSDLHHTRWTCGESMALITALLYRPGSIGRIKDWTNTLLDCQKTQLIWLFESCFFKRQKEWVWRKQPHIPVNQTLYKLSGALPRKFSWSIYPWKKAVTVPLVSEKFSWVFSLSHSLLQSHFYSHL